MASKAEKFARTIHDLKPNDFKISKFGDNGGVYTIIGRVDDNGNLLVGTSNRSLKSKEALEFAKWIINNFGDDDEQQIFE